MKAVEVAFNVDFNGIYDNEYTAFDVYFASVCSMQFHPGAGTKEHRSLSIEECGAQAVEMLKVRRRVACLSEVKNPELVGELCRGE